MDVEYLKAQLASLLDQREQTNVAENALGRALYRQDKEIAKVRAALDALVAQPVTPTTVDAQNQPQTNINAPVAVEPPPTPVALDGEVDVIQTASGTWRVRRALSQGDVTAYAWSLDGNPDWKRVVVVRQLSAIALTALDAQPITIDGVTMTVAPGAVRVWQNGSPVPFRWDWLKAAVDQGRTAGIGPVPVAKLYKPFVIPALPAYDPTVISPMRAGVVADASTNSVGVTGGQGGEYDASRGFYHNYDATAVRMAQAGTGTPEMAAFLERITLDQLSHPQGGPWSQVNDGLADPQIPYAGDTAHISSSASSVTFPTGWGRDLQHLENSCWAHWLATADPLAGLCIQRQTAWMLASHHGAWRVAGRYTYGQGIERANLNALSSVWKTRDVARGISASGKTLYDRARAEKMFADIIAWTDEKVARPIYTQDAPTNLTSGNINDLLPIGRYASRLAGSVLEQPYQNPVMRTELDGSTTYFLGTSDFTTGQYGSIILPLLVKDGNETARVWAGHISRFISVRLALGYRGVEGTEETRGSIVATGPAVYETRTSTWGPKTQAWPVMPEPDYGAWLARFNRGPTDSFDGSNVHTVIQMRNMLASLADVGVPLNPSLLATVDATIDATAEWKHELRDKHLCVVR